MKLGNAIKQIRKDKNISQIELSRLTGISNTSLSFIELNKKVPSQANLYKIADALQVPTALLYFCALDINDVTDDKKEMFKNIYPIVLDLIKKIV